MAIITENPLSWVYFPTALTLGALHALEPGHAKALTASYLIGIKGTKRDALLLGLAVACTHSIVVVGIAACALWLGREAFTQDVTYWLQIASGIIVIILGSSMLVRRLLQMRRSRQHDSHHDLPAPVQVNSELLRGVLEIVDAEAGAQFRLRCQQPTPGLILRVIVNRFGGLEQFELKQHANGSEYLSTGAPGKPHEFSAELEIIRGDQRDVMLFEIHASRHHHHDHDHDHDHHHDHAHMSDDEHACAHAAAMPEYAKRGERPTFWQILTYGAAAGMIPCPASITVMLLALSVGKLGAGLVAVSGFSIGLALTLVGLGLVVVSGLSRLEGRGGFHWVSRHAPVLSAVVVILSGCAALFFVH